MDDNVVLEGNSDKIVVKKDKGKKSKKNKLNEVENHNNNNSIDIDKDIGDMNANININNDSDDFVDNSFDKNPKKDINFNESDLNEMGIDNNNNNNNNETKNRNIESDNEKVEIHSSTYPKELNPFFGDLRNEKDQAEFDKIQEIQRVHDTLKKGNGKNSAIFDSFSSSNLQPSFSRGLSMDEKEAEIKEAMDPHQNHEDKNKNAPMCSIKRWISPSFREAREISYISIIFTLASFIADLIVSVDGDSTATLSAGIDSLLDVISSLFVIWRFFGNAREDVLIWKERVADFSLSWLFMISSAVIFAMAVQHLIDEEKITDENILLDSNIPSFVILFILAALKYHIARSLESETMIKDAIGSFSGAGVSLGVCIGVALEMSNPDIWWADAAIAVFIAVSVFYVGLKSLCYMGRWWTKSFWTVSIDEELPDGITGDVQLA